MRSFIANTLFASLSVAATAAIVAFSSTPASAAIPANDAPRAEIHYSDIDLANPKGTRTLEARIRLAADRVCPANTPGIDLAAAQCRANAIAQAHREIDERLALRSTTATSNAAL